MHLVRHVSFTNVRAVRLNAKATVYLCNDFNIFVFLSFKAIFFDTTSPLSDQILITALQLLNKEISDHGRHLSHYFSLFHMYCTFGNNEKEQLLRVRIAFIVFFKYTRKYETWYDGFAIFFL